MRFLSLTIICVLSVCLVTGGCAYRQGGMEEARPAPEAHAVPAPSAQYVPVPDGALPAGSEGLPLTSPRVLYLDTPRYPSTARATDMEGVVSVEILIDPRGVVTGAEVVETTSDVFNTAALQAAYHCRFEPGKVGGVPIPFKWIIPFEFALRHYDDVPVGGVGPGREPTTRGPETPDIDPDKEGRDRGY